MPDNPFVSVVMAVYNGEPFLPLAIESILNQTYRNFEFIIVNDGSTDSTKAILENYAAQDPRIVLVEQENQGLSVSLNAAISVSKGDLIARMDSDDYSFPRRLELQVAKMVECPSIGVCGTAAIAFSEKKVVRILRHPSNSKLLKSKLFFSVCFIHPTVMIRSELLSGSAYSEEFFAAQDYKLWVDLRDNAEFTNLDKVLLAYRINDLGITRSKKTIELKINLVRNLQSSVASSLPEKVKKKIYLISTNDFLRSSSLKPKELNALVQVLMKYFLKDMSSSFTYLRVLAVRLFSAVMLLAKTGKVGIIFLLLHPLFWWGAIEKFIDELIRFKLLLNSNFEIGEFEKILKYEISKKEVGKYTSGNYK